MLPQVANWFYKTAPKAIRYEKKSLIFNKYFIHMKVLSLLAHVYYRIYMLMMLISADKW